MDPIAHGARQRHHIFGGGPATICQRQRMFGGKPAWGGAGIRIALAEAGPFHQPAGGQLDAVGRGIVRDRTVLSGGRVTGQPFVNILG